MQALAYQAQDAVAQAIVVLEEALSLAEPEGFVRIFVDEGEAMSGLLKQAASRGIAPLYIGVVHFRRTIRFTFLQREKMFIFSTLSHAQAEMTSYRFLSMYQKCKPNSEPPLYIDTLLAAFYIDLPRKPISPQAKAKDKLVAFSSAAAPVATPAHEPLTERELQALRLLATDLSPREIANEMIVSVNTVRTYTKYIYSKLDVHSRVEAIHKAKELGLL
ncbi:LuxR C-terminal-related transcriptional regulator [Chloroflexi bacterium TSY]|nr:LuxR C-terminal-related transcriptional regulator [Chloroflexi bacterium TSY]